MARILDEPPAVNPKPRPDLQSLAGWALAALAVAAGYVGWGWQGVVLAVTVVVFWLLLQFSRALRVLRAAGASPVGRTANAVMLHARLHPGMRLPQVLKHSGSLGREVSAAPEVWAWSDAAGDAVHVHFEQGRLVRTELHRAAPS